MLFNTAEVRNVSEKLILRHYLNKQMKYGTARPTDLWESFEQFVSISNRKQIKISIKEIMDTWTDQSGYPVVNATLNNYKLTLTQVMSHTLYYVAIFLSDLKILQSNLILLF